MVGLKEFGIAFVSWTKCNKCKESVSLENSKRVEICVIDIDENKIKVVCKLIFRRIMKLLWHSLVRQKLPATEWHQNYSQLLVLY